MSHYEVSGQAPLGIVAGQASGKTFYELGMMYATGRDVPANLVEAHKWMNIAVARGYQPAVERRAELAEEMAPHEIATAQREARIWLTRH